MNRLKLVIFIATVFVLQSCYKSGEIQVQNNISNVVIEDVYWGDNYLSSELMPGEKSSVNIINKYEEELPSSNTITFKMTANNSSIYLQTVEKFTLNQDEKILIVLEDSTKVVNPNQ